ncbi:MAG: hypothetical protein WKG07_00140 [Hymenobacter sp.]
MKVAALVGVGSTLVAASRGDKKAFADASANDLEILNYALTLEYLEASSTPAGEVRHLERPHPGAGDAHPRPRAGARHRRSPRR